VTGSRTGPARGAGASICRYHFPVAEGEHNAIRIKVMNPTKSQRGARRSISVFPGAELFDGARPGTLWRDVYGPTLDMRRLLTDYGLRGVHP